MEELFSLTDTFQTTTISNLPLFLESLCLNKYCIKYTKKQIITLTSYLQSIYPQIYLNNNQPLLDYKTKKQPVDYLCMNPACREKCTKPLESLLYTLTTSKRRRKHDYSFLITDPKKILPSLCCITCNKIISRTNDDSVLFKDTRYVNNVYRNITKENSNPKDFALYQTFLRVENIVSIDSRLKIPFARTNTKKGYTWRILHTVCIDLSYQTLIERRMVMSMKGNTIQRKLDDIHSKPILLPNDGTTIIRLSTKHVNQISQGRKRTSISFLDSNGKKHMKKLNNKKEFEFEGVVYQLIPDQNMDDLEQQIIDSYLQENGLTLENLKDHGLDQLQLQMDDYGQLLCYLTNIKLSFEKGSLFYLSPERLDQSKPYLYKSDNGQIQRNFVFIAQLLNTTKQMTKEKWLAICLSYYINQHYGVTIELCHRVSNGDYQEIPKERVNIIQKHLASVQKTYNECITYCNKSHGEKYQSTKPILYESLRKILGNINKSGKKNKSKQGDIFRIEQLLDLWKSNYGLCHYSEHKMNIDTGSNQDFQPSPERLNDSGSYSESNVRFICAELNVGKVKGYNDTHDETGSNSKKILRELIETTIQHYKFAKILEKKYYTEEEINSMSIQPFLGTPFPRV
jgi:hypothetical protein